MHRLTSPVALLTALAALTVAVYWPALYGGYIFDDSFYFVENTTAHVTSLRLGDWVAAAVSQAGLHQFRALSMLTLAANYYFTGLDPFWVKLTNVGIHVLNGVFLFLLTRALFRLNAECARDNSFRARARDVTAACVAGAWLLLPINLSGVAYVSQRMESLANLFVFAALFAYLYFRRDEFLGRPRPLALGLSVLFGMLIGFSAKESAVLLPLYTACAEFSITGFRNRDGRYSRPVLVVHALLLLLPFLIGIAWISSWDFRSVANVRDFSVGERLFTEPRVLLHYIQWTLLPNLNDLTFYHDDFPISHGLTDPPTTLFSIAALLALGMAAIWQRHRRPLLCLGVLWFLAGHAMTATIIPLELVFEHRNYFPSAGLLIAMGSLLASEHGLLGKGLRATIGGAFIALFAFTTLLRAQEWSHPLRLAFSEAEKRPGSARAQYELARTLIAAAGDDQSSPLIAESRRVLERDALLPGSGIAPLQALIYLNGRAHQPIDPAWWQTIDERLGAHAPSQTDIQALIFLYHCQRRQICVQQPQELMHAFATALERSGGNALLVSAYAEFAVNELGEVELAGRLFRELVATHPQLPVYRVDLARFLIATGQYAEAAHAIDDLAALNQFGSLDPIIAELRSALEKSAAPVEPDAKTAG